ncbi:hypothetical protein, partial [Streptomyces sp. NPDC058964]|uniref:hypothetical protein n=1 Tax=Streptomyces sp. NPDC058964 TaxID=3346681 RepID=UPI00368D0407
LCAAQRVPLAIPGADVDVHLALDRWLRDSGDGRRDLVATIADPGFRALLLRAVGTLGEHRSASDLQQAAAHPVLSDVLREWLQAAAEEFTGSAGLPGARAALDRLRPFHSVAGRVGPLAVAGVAAHDVAPLLGRTLRAGILDELGWPALEEGLRLLDEKPRKGEDNTLTVTEAWPALILARPRKAVVVGPDGILLEHELRLPADLDRWQRPRFRYTDGELLVMWRQGAKQSAYWSNRPDEVFTLGGEQIPTWWSSNDTGTPSIPLPGGGRATGGRTLHAGDTVLPPARPVMGDGTAYWRQGRQGRETVWLEYDPGSGTHGRASLPAFLRSGIREGASLQAAHCEVLPLQPGLEHSPFGTDGTVLGRWVRREGTGAEARTVTGTPDGRTVALPAERGRVRAVPLGALRLPGGAEPVVARVNLTVSLFAADDTSSTGELGRVTPHEQGGEFAAGTRFVPPVAFWHALRPRDERGSAVLRALTDERAAGMLRVTAADLAERQERLARAGGADGRPATRTGDGEPAVPTADEVALKAVRGALPELTDERLLTGVAALVRSALRITESATAFVTPPRERPRPSSRTEGMFADYSPRHGEDRDLHDAAAGIADLSGWWGGERWSVLRQIRSVNHVLSGEPADGRPLPDRERHTDLGDGWRSDEHTVPGIGMVWPSVLSGLRPLAYRAASPALTDAQREPLLLLFEAVGEGPLAAPDGTLREIVLSEPHDRQQRAGQVLRREGRTVVVLGCQSVDSQRERVNWLALDHDPSGAFGAVAHFTLDKETRHTSAISSERLAAVTRLIRDKGAAVWRPEAPAELAAATGGGLGPLQATVLLAGQPSAPGAEGLAVMGLKPRQRDFGTAMLGSVARRDRAALIGALLPEDPADLWTAGPDTRAAGRVWAERLASFVRLPEDTAADLAGVSVASAEAVLNPARTPWLSRTTVQRPDKDGNLIAQDPAAVPGRYDITRAVDALATLAYALPYGHALRAVLPDGLAALRRRLSDPELLVDLDIEWTEKGGSTAVELRKAFGLPTAGGADAHGLTRLGEALVLRPWYGDTETVLVRPAGLGGPDDAVLGLVEGLVGRERGGGVRALRTILGDDLARALAAGTDADGPTGHAQDAGASVPALVAEVAAARGLSGDAAALYLQLLALPDPTDRDCARWTGWKPTRLKKARAELAATDLVVEAKRPRAGRTQFLPCGWYDLKAPALPVETWKEGLYPVTGRSRAVPLVAVPELFARAWDRVRAGDAPAYEELTTRATRKGRRR